MPPSFGGAPHRYLIRLGLFVLCAALAAPAYGNAPFTADDLVRLQRVADPQASSDGRYVIFVLRATDMAANRGHTHWWLIDRTAVNAPARVLALNAANDSSPRAACRTVARFIFSRHARAPHKSGDSRSAPKSRCR
jgi:hypothetical protein